MQSSSHRSDGGKVPAAHASDAVQDVFILTVQDGYKDYIATPFSDGDRAVEAAV